MKKIINIISENYIIFCVYALIGWLYEVAWFLFNKNVFLNRGVLFGPFLPIYGFGALLLIFILKKFLTKKHTTENVLYTSISTFVIVTFIYTTIIEYTTPKIYNVMTYLKQYGIYLIVLNVVAIILVNIIVKKFKIKIDTTIILSFLAIWIIPTLLEFISHLVLDECFNLILWDYSNDFLNIDSRVNWDASRSFAFGGTFLLYILQPILTKLLNKLSDNKKLIIALVIGIPMLIDFMLVII